jgi:catalase
MAVSTVDKAVPNRAEPQKKSLFLPGQLTDGIKESDDPLIDDSIGLWGSSACRAC